ncbi:hypothetical protein BE04_03870 [Sorangium cellulosum]|uniref:Uncharacterized protein n=2 Tax=Sorangium cellulosum TaxID=56 RepID=A0A150Q3P0_SORCE|nr:hypothetical protein [Sorangium cellulosum]KYF62433.1 hypothetical protein BE04_03870 [Sorangium cellulosum]
MPNTNVFTGMDGAITVAVESGAEGDAAKAVADIYGLAPIGRAQGVTVEVMAEMRPFHEMGQRYATELRSGNVEVRGSIARAHVNGALLKLMLGEGAGTSRPAGAFVSPTFNLSLRMVNAAKPDNSSTITVHGVKLNGWSFAMPEDDFVLERVTFKALWISVEDSGE